MANPQTENGYTVICNEILEAISKTKLNGTQFRIVMVIWRSTYGWNKKEHDISETFLSNATGIHKKQINREMKGLIEKKIITIVKESTRSQSRVLRFNKNYDEWEPISRVVTKTLGGNELVDSCGNELVDSCGNENAPQKRKIKNKIKNNEILSIAKKLYEIYPVKNKGKKLTKKAEKVIEKYGYDVLAKCIELYKQRLKRDNTTEEKYIKGFAPFIGETYYDYLDLALAKEEPQQKRQIKVIVCDREGVS